MKIIHKDFWVFILVVVITGVLIYTKHKPREYFHYEGEIFSDRAGYYIYLPGAFVYHFDGSEFSEEMITTLGYGFHVDSINEKIVTKYPVGVALLQVPLFLVTHGYNHVVGSSTDGFTGNYHNVMNWAAWVYGSLGLWLFYLFLLKKVRRSTALLMLMVVYFGTSVYHYGADNTGMSHIYSFFLFSAFLWLGHRILKCGFSWKRALLIGAISGLIVVTRPINGLFIIMATVYLLLMEKKDKSWVKHEISFTKVLGAMALGFIMILPQLLYWKLVHGQWIYYSYGSEGFSNWNNPPLIPFLFAPKAGLFSYAPVYLLAVLAMIYSIRKKQNLWLIIGFFGFCYLMSSWHVYYFGCSFGSRNLVEYAPLFFTPLACQLDGLNKYARRSLSLVLIICTLFTISLAASFSGCYYGDTWDWREYNNMALGGVYYKSTGDKEINADQLYSGINCENHRMYSLSGYAFADVKLKVEGYSEQTELVFEIYNDSIVEYATFNVMEEMEKDGGDAAYYRFLIKREETRDATYKFYIYNEGNDELYLEKLAVWLH